MNTKTNQAKALAAAEDAIRAANAARVSVDLLKKAVAAHSSGGARCRLRFKFWDFC